MKTALLNTVLGMGIVFIALILIAFIIALIGVVPKLLRDRTKEETISIVKEEAAVEETSYEELIDDTELVAVITAAIMASMGDEAPADGLVVRSIRRMGRRKLA